MARRSKRVPLSAWSDRGLHVTARKLRNLLMGEGISRKQDWLLTAIINEMEWRYSRRGPLRFTLVESQEWTCLGCELCRPGEGAIPGQQRLVYVPPPSSD